MRTRITEEVLRQCSARVQGHVCFVVCPSPEATDRIYPPTQDNRLRVHAATLRRSVYASRSKAPPVRLRVALTDTNAGASILQNWPLPTPGQHS